MKHLTHKQFADNFNTLIEQDMLGTISELTRRITDQYHYENKKAEAIIKAEFLQLNKAQQDAVLKAEKFGWRFYGIHRTEKTAYLSHAGKKMRIGLDGKRIK